MTYLLAATIYQPTDRDPQAVPALAVNPRGVLAQRGLGTSATRPYPRARGEDLSRMPRRVESQSN